MPWLPWSKESFSLAQQQKRPILLSLCAAWSLGCRKMDAEAFSDSGVIELVKKRYVPIRVDSDERPDVNLRYNQGAWPTTAFLTPQGDILYSGAYYGAYELKSLLDRIADLYQTQHAQIEAEARRIAKRVEFVCENPTVSNPDALTDLIPANVQSVLRIYYDEKYGGFDDTGKKFPHAASIDFLLYEHRFTGDPEFLMMANRTLGAMADAGIHDPLDGGFFRYAVSSDWRIPLFVKMCDENANHIRNYLEAYQATGNGFYRRVAEETIRYVRETLSDRAAGFYLSQSAEEGDGYYTWSKEQLQQALSPEEAEVVTRHFGVGEARNEVRNEKGQYILNVTRSIQGIARELHLSANDVKERLDSALAKMRRVRARREPPTVDERIFTDANARMASSFLEAGAVLDRRDLSEFALRTLDLLIARGYRKETGMAHCIREGGPPSQGFLSDQAQTAQALLDAYVATGDALRLGAAKELVATMRSRFQDLKSGGYHDRVREPDPIGRLGLPETPMEANCVVARVLLRLSRLTGEAQYETDARRVLGLFTDSYEMRQVMAAGYALAVRELLHPPLTLVVVGSPDSPATQALLRGALRFYDPRKVVVPLDPSGNGKRLQTFGLPANAKPGLYPRYKAVIGDPITDPAKIAESLRAFAEKHLTEEK